MRDCDIRVRGAAVDFEHVELAIPFALSGASITWFTVVRVRVDVVDRLGRTAEGTARSALSVPWSWPRSALSVVDRDLILRDITSRLAASLIDLEPGDPFQMWRSIGDLAAGTTASSAAAAGSPDPVPELAVALAVGVVDNAVHDGWSRCAGLPAMKMYGPEFLNADLGGCLGPAMSAAYPEHFLTEPELRLPVQHVVGASDPLRSAGQHSTGRTLTDWICTDGLSQVKIKVAGRSAVEDAERIVDVYTAIVAGANGPPVLALDPNEAYRNPAEVCRLLDLVAAHSESVLGAVRFVEQPIGRDAHPDPAELRALAARVPVLLDEGLARVSDLPRLIAAGWSGLVIKAAKGQTSALLGYSYARANELFVTVQDLTSVDTALEHSARLVSSFELSARHLEFNSRQYAPDANRALQQRHPELTRVVDGQVRVESDTEPGIY